MSSTSILVVEDDKMLLSLLSFRLEKEGYEITTCKDGREAKSLIKEIQPDLVISDILMPYVSGLEIISYIRGELNMTIPIVILSAAGQEKTVLEAFELGADDFMAKPFSPNELIIRVKKILLRNSNKR